jgi:hypothetical protein
VSLEISEVVKDPAAERVGPCLVGKMLLLPFAGYCRDGAGKQNDAHTQEDGDKRLRPRPPGARIRVIDPVTKDLAPEPPDQAEIENKKDPIDPSNPPVVVRKKLKLQQ